MEKARSARGVGGLGWGVEELWSVNSRDLGPRPSYSLRKDRRCHLRR